MTSQVITSIHNPRVRAAARLRDARRRRDASRFLIDGVRETSRALAGQVPLVEVFVCAELCRSDEARQLIEVLREDGVPLCHVTETVFRRVAFGDRAEGVVAVGELRGRSLADFKPSADALVAVLDGLEKPGNLGAIVRSADAAGVSAVIVASGGLDLFNPNTIRASLGTLFTLPVFTAEAGAALDWLRGRRFRVLAARVGAKCPYTRADYSGRTAIVLGSEADGLSDLWNVDGVTSVSIPMRGQGDSLNVSTTAAVLFYEALRQREERGKDKEEG